METTKPIPDLVAEDLMSRDGVAIPRLMPMRDAAHLLRRSKAARAAVVDDQGRCIGVLSDRDFLRWAEEDGRPPSCPYQTKGLVHGSPEVVTCTLDAGSCLLQLKGQITGDRRAPVCRDPNSFCNESQMTGDPVSAGESYRYMTSDFVTAGLRTPLPELARAMNEAQATCIVVVDGRGLFAGIVSGAASWL